MPKFDIVYEDNHLLVVVKPPNLLTQGDDTGDICLHEHLKAYIKETYHKPGAVYLGLVHRLDRPVGGLVAFAKTSKCASRLSSQLRSHQMKREYLAVVQGTHLPDEGTLVDTLFKDASSGMVRVVTDNIEGAQKACLHYAVLARNEDADTALLHIRLETGRKHQIRVQLSHMGHPILYDMRYGEGVKGQNIALFGAMMHLSHPTKQTPLLLTATPSIAGFAPYAPVIETFLSNMNEVD